MANIYLPLGTTANVIKVGGDCYERVGESTNAITPDISIEGTYEDCEECETPPLPLAGYSVSGSNSYTDLNGIYCQEGNGYLVETGPGEYSLETSEFPDTKYYKHADSNIYMIKLYGDNMGSLIPLGWKLIPCSNFSSVCSSYHAHAADNFQDTPPTTGWQNIYTDTLSVFETTCL